MKNIQYKNINFYIGSNANENWKLLEDSKNINDNYIWFHLNSFPSPYVIMYSTLDQIKLDGSFCDIDNILTFGANLPANCRIICAKLVWGPWGIRFGPGGRGPNKLYSWEVLGQFGTDCPTIFLTVCFKSNYFYCYGECQYCTSWD